MTQASPDEAAASRPSAPADDQRDALAGSQREASRTHPENFKEEENADKIIEVPDPDEMQDKPIQNLDPESDRPG